MRVGLVNGCFDLFHAGHRHFILAALRMCDTLVVGINTDESIQRLKGEGRPAWRLAERISKVAYYRRCVPVPFDGDVLGLVRRVNPLILIRGQDQSTLGAELAPVFVQIPRWGDTSTTKLLEEIKLCGS